MIVNFHALSAVLAVVFLVTSCDEQEKKKASSEPTSVTIDAAAIKKWTKIETTINGQITGSTERTVSNGLVTQSEIKNADGSVALSFVYDYDTENRLVSETSVDASNGLTNIYSYEYDGQSRLAKRALSVNGKVISTWNYDYDNKSITARTFNTQAEEEEILFETIETYVYAGSTRENNANFLILLSSQTKNSSGEVTGDIEVTCDNNDNPTRCTSVSNNRVTGQKSAEDTTTHSLKDIIVGDQTFKVNLNFESSGTSFDSEGKEASTGKSVATYNANFELLNYSYVNDNLSDDSQDSATTETYEYDATNINVTKLTTILNNASGEVTKIDTYTY